MFASPDWDKTKLWDKPGGAMNVLPVPGRDFSFLAIQKFFQGFQAEGSGIYYVEPDEVEEKSWNIQRVIDLPFVHRIQVVKVGSKPYLVAATLCEGKDYEEDWSRPGSVYAGAIPEERSSTWELQPILEGVSKNHGMWHSEGDPETLYISGKEGVFELEVPEKAEAGWDVTQLLGHEVSDLSLYDVDGDGKKEIVTIEPFHGDDLKIYRNINGSWKQVFRRDINFGHVVWAGHVGGSPGVIAGSRGGRRELELLRLDQANDGLSLKSREVLDEGGAPMQVSVVNKEGSDLICTSNGDRDEVTLYKIS